jgi:ribulose kinase
MLNPPRQDLVRIFNVWVRAITQLTKDVLEAATAKGVTLENVAFVGGGSCSPVL